MSSKITVGGCGKAVCAPDLAQIDLTLESRDPDYGKCLEINAQKLGGISAAAEKLGFEKSELKTAAYNISPRYETVQDGKTYKSVLAGFSCVHTLTLSVKASDARLNGVLNEFASSDAVAKINLRFLLSNADDVKRGLLSDALADARKKAEVLAKAAGSKELKLKSVAENGAIGGEFYSRSSVQSNMLRACADAAVPEVTPEDAEISVSIITEWEI